MSFFFGLNHNKEFTELKLAYIFEFFIKQLRLLRYLGLGRICTMSLKLFYTHNDHIHICHIMLWWILNEGQLHNYFLKEITQLFVVLVKFDWLSMHNNFIQLILFNLLV